MSNPSMDNLSLKELERVVGFHKSGHCADGLYACNKGHGAELLKHHFEENIDAIENFVNDDRNKGIPAQWTYSKTSDSTSGMKKHSYKDQNGAEKILTTKNVKFVQAVRKSWQIARQHDYNRHYNPPHFFAVTQYKRLEKIGVFSRKTWKANQGLEAMKALVAQGIMCCTYDFRNAVSDRQSMDYEFHFSHRKLYGSVYGKEYFLWEKMVPFKLTEEEKQIFRDLRTRPAWGMCKGRGFFQRICRDYERFSGKGKLEDFPAYEVHPKWDEWAERDPQKKLHFDKFDPKKNEFGLGGNPCRIAVKQVMREHMPGKRNELAEAMKIHPHEVDKKDLDRTFNCLHFCVRFVECFCTKLHKKVPLDCDFTQVWEVKSIDQPNCQARKARIWANIHRGAVLPNLDWDIMTLKNLRRRQHRRLQGNPLQRFVTGDWQGLNDYNGEGEQANAKGSPDAPVSHLTFAFSDLKWMLAFFTFGLTHLGAPKDATNDAGDLVNLDHSFALSNAPEHYQLEKENYEEEHGSFPNRVEQDAIENEAGEQLIGVTNLNFVHHKWNNKKRNKPLFVQCWEELAGPKGEWKCLGKDGEFHRLVEFAQQYQGVLDRIGPGKPPEECPTMVDALFFQFWCTQKGKSNGFLMKKMTMHKKKGNPPTQEEINEVSDFLKDHQCGKKEGGGHCATMKDYIECHGEEKEEEYQCSDAEGDNEGMESDDERDLEK